MGVSLKLIVSSELFRVISQSELSYTSNAWFDWYHSWCNTCVHMTTDPLYLDYNASTPMDERVLAEVVEVARTSFANPHSKEHALAWRAAEVASKAATRILNALRAPDYSVVFTSGATEANNLALRGLWEHSISRGKCGVAASRFEHPCVREVIGELVSRGAKVQEIEVSPRGVVESHAIERACNQETGIVSLMAVNNEIGTVQPVETAAAIAHRYGAIVHTDASQAVGRIPIDIAKWGTDLFTISGHKCYGPKGIGALIVRNSVATLLQPLILGGGQQFGLRSGTLPVELCAGLARAVELSVEGQAVEWQQARALRDVFLKSLREFANESPLLNGCMDTRVPHNLNLRFPGIPAETLLDKLDSICISRGSACSREGNKPSATLTSLGLESAAIEESVRITFGRSTTLDQAKAAAQHIGAAIIILRGA